MRATVYHLYGTVGVCYVHPHDGEPGRVGEARIVDGNVRILPQSLRAPAYVIEVDAPLDDEVHPDDPVAYAVMGIQRFRKRLSEQDDFMRGADTAELDEEIDGCVADLMRLRRRSRV